MPVRSLKRPMTALQYMDTKCHSRGEMFGMTVIDPDGKAGVILMSEWGPGEDLTLRLKPPGLPDPEWRRADGSKPETVGGLEILTTDDLLDGFEVNNEHCWKVPASKCRMPKRQPVWD